MQAGIRHYAQAWHEALKTADSKDQSLISRRMLRRLQMEGRLSWLSRIVVQVQSIEDAELGIVDVRVRVAIKASSEQIKPIVADLLKIDDMRLTIEEESGLMGGMIVQTSDYRWDISMRKQLSDLKKALK